MADSTNTKSNSTRLNIRLSKEELATIKTRAKNSGHTTSDYVRICCTTDREGPQITTDANKLHQIFVNLRRAGGNVNQIARELSTRHRPDELEAEILAALRTISQASEDVSNFIADARRSV